MQSVEASKAGQKALTQEQVDEFWANGFLKVGKILDDDEIEALRNEYDHVFAEARTGKINFRNLAIDPTDDLETKNKAGKQMLQIMQMCEISMPFRRLIYHQRILDVIEDLIGPNIQLFHDQALLNLPFRVARSTGTRTMPMRCTPANLVSAWMTLDDVDEQNGAMQFLPVVHTCKTVGHARASTSSARQAVVRRRGQQKSGCGVPAGAITIRQARTLQ